MKKIVLHFSYLTSFYEIIKLNNFFSLETSSFKCKNAEQKQNPKQVKNHKSTTQITNQEPKSQSPKSVLPKIAKEPEKDLSELFSDVRTSVIKNYEMR